MTAVTCSEFSLSEWYGTDLWRNCTQNVYTSNSTNRKMMRWCDFIFIKENLWNLACNILASIWIYKPWAAVNRKAKLVFVLLPGGHTRSPQCVSQLSLLRSKDRIQQRLWVLALWALPRVNFGSCPSSMPQSCRRGAGATPVFSVWLGTCRGNSQI